MNEVACRVFEVFKGRLAAKKLSFADMVAGTSVSAEKLNSRTERIDWADFVAIMSNLRPHFTDEEYVAIGRSTMRTPGLRFASVVARLMLAPIDLYRWMHQPHTGLGNQYFAGVTSTYREESPNRLVMEMTLPEGFEMCWEFFLVVSGNHEVLPELFGLPPANVTLTRIPRGARLDVSVPTWRVPVVKRLKGWLLWPVTARVAARELKEAHETLVDVQSQMAEFARRLRQAEQLSTLAVLTAGLAQEFRNPANGIVNAIEPLVEQLPKELVGPTTGPGQLLEVISGCAEQLSALSRELIGLKRDPHLDKAPVYVTEVVDRAVHLARGALDRVDVRVSRSLVLRIECSKPLLAQALTNLVENAGHAAGPGGWVQIAMKATATLVQIEVSDSGAGVPVALRDRVFEPFFTTKARNGTGLGLCVARAIVQLHRGVLEIRECDGRSAFVIEIPVVAPPQPRFAAQLHSKLANFTA